MEIPLELMLTITQNKPWMFFPDIIPLGHPIFDVIESTDPEVHVCSVILQRETKLLTLSLNVS
jgi:hypothetical protein